MNFKQYAKDAIEFSKGLFAIDSPTGFTEKVTEHVLETAKSMGYSAYRNNLGNVIVTVEGENNDKEVALSAHVDTLGLMVRSITAEGDLMFTVVGGPIVPTLDGEYCRIYTRGGKVYTGTILSLSPAVHVHPDSETIWQLDWTKLYTARKMWRRLESLPETSSAMIRKQLLQKAVS